MLPNVKRRLLQSLANLETSHGMLKASYWGIGLDFAIAAKTRQTVAQSRRLLAANNSRSCLCDGTSQAELHSRTYGKPIENYHYRR
jgi:hypothetical protein